MSLDELRVKIDSVDDELKKLFLRRMEIVHDIACIKAESGDNIYKPDREKAVIERLSAGIDESLKDDYIKFVTEVIGISREYQKRIIDEIRSGNSPLNS